MDEGRRGLFDLPIVVLEALLQQLWLSGDYKSLCRLRDTSITGFKLVTNFLSDKQSALVLDELKFVSICPERPVSGLAVRLTAASKEIFSLSGMGPLRAAIGLPDVCIKYCVVKEREDKSVYFWYPLCGSGAHKALTSLGTLLEGKIVKKVDVNGISGYRDAKVLTAVLYGTTIGQMHVRVVHPFNDDVVRCLIYLIGRKKFDKFVLAFDEFFGTLGEELVSAIDGAAQTVTLQHYREKPSAKPILGLSRERWEEIGLSKEDGSSYEVECGDVEGAMFMMLSWGYGFVEEEEEEEGQEDGEGDGVDNDDEAVGAGDEGGKEEDDEDVLIDVVTGEAYPRLP